MYKGYFDSLCWLVGLVVVVLGGAVAFILLIGGCVVVLSNIFRRSSW